MNSTKECSVVIDYQQCKQVVQSLYDFFEDKSELATVEYPSNISYKTNEYYLYMFYSCLLDYGMRSKVYHKNLALTYQKYPNIFIPKKVLEMDETYLSEIMTNHIHPRYPNVAVKKWIRLSQKLNQFDNILNVLKDINCFEKLNLFVKNMNSYGQKTGGLLIRIICDSEICNFTENVESIPIDRHDIEISYLTGIINNGKVSEKNVKMLSDVYVRCGKEMNINPSDIDKYLWEIGSVFCNQKQCENCPINLYCEKERS